QLASAQLARHYGLPSSIGTFATGAKGSDWQAGVEGGLSVMSSWLAGADLLCGAGLLHGARVHSTVEMLLDAELFDLACGLSDRMRADEEDLATQAILEAGPGGHFLAHPHTRRHMRRRWRSSLFGRETWEEWESSGRPGATDRARERVRQILAEHRPPAHPGGDRRPWALSARPGPCEAGFESSPSPRATSIAFTRRACACSSRPDFASRAAGSSTRSPSPARRSRPSRSACASPDGWWRRRSPARRRGTRSRR